MLTFILVELRQVVLPEVKAGASSRPQKISGKTRHGLRCVQVWVKL
jgi:hypothetical protein